MQAADQAAGQIRLRLLHPLRDRKLEKFRGAGRGGRIGTCSQTWQWGIRLAGQNIEGLTRARSATILDGK